MCRKAVLLSCYRVLLWGDCDGQTDQRSAEGHPLPAGGGSSHGGCAHPMHCRVFLKITLGEHGRHSELSSKEAGDSSFDNFLKVKVHLIIGVHV